jgi:pyruvate dehydrogenase (quinone)
VLDRLAADDAIFTCDVGTPTIWAARYLTMNGKRRILGSFNHGSMANAMPQSIGAQASHPGRQVISMCGGGGEDAHGRFAHASSTRLACKASRIQERFPGVRRARDDGRGHRRFWNSSYNPNFAKIAEGAGLLGLTAETADDVEPMIAKALKFDGPALVEIPVPRQELSMPPAITYEQAKGFGLFMLRVVLNGRADELIDLAKVNLIR